MSIVPKMVDMRRTPEAKGAENMAISPGPQNDYSYGLCISLGNEELEKLDLKDCEVGEMVHLFAMAEVTSVSKNSTDKGEQHRVELQIKFLGVEDEDEENEEEDMRPAKDSYKSMYNEGEGE